MKLVIFAVVGLALLAGGVSGFRSALIGIVFLLIAVGIVGITCLFIVRSTLAQHTKSGWLLIIFGLVVGLVWQGMRAPREWPQDVAKVTSIKGPPAETNTEYAYIIGDVRNGITYKTAQTKTWEKLVDAQKFKAGQMFVHYNPRNPSEVKIDPEQGWVRVRANPTATKVRQTGYATATFSVGSGFSGMSATTTGPDVADYSVGGTFPIWREPVAWKELSLEPRKTVGGQQYGILVTSLALLVGGVSTLAFGKSWFSAPMRIPMREAAPDSTPFVHVPRQPTIAEQLAAIDWFQFEAVSARIMEFDGWNVVRSGGAKPDGGADIIATRNGRRAIVQCKFWRRVEITPRIIREVLGTKATASFRADEAYLFTFSDLTEAAASAARADNVIVFDAEMIVSAIGRIGVARFPELTHPDDKTCPKCGAGMVLVTRTAKPFWGCSTYGRTRCVGKFERV